VRGQQAAHCKLNSRSEMALEMFLEPVALQVSNMIRDQKSKIYPFDFNGMYEFCMN
jgi:hypothetical protein